MATKEYTDTYELPAPITVRGTKSARDADEVLRCVFTELEMTTIRAEVEEVRNGHVVGANHYDEALVKIGWPNERYRRERRLYERLRQLGREVEAKLS